jgi:hypothetical protein
LAKQHNFPIFSVLKINIQVALEIEKRFLLLGEFRNSSIILITKRSGYLNSSSFIGFTDVLSSSLKIVN